MIKVFLDSSVIIAGIHSSTGASHIILEASHKKIIIAFVSSMVIKEVVKNLKKKFPKVTLRKFIKFLPDSNFNKIGFVNEKEVLAFQKLTKEKDIHVLAAAFSAKVDYLVTLDKKHLLRLRSKSLPFVILTPGELVERPYDVKSQPKR